MFDRLGRALIRYPAGEEPGSPYDNVMSDWAEIQEDRAAAEDEYQRLMKEDPEFRERHKKVVEFLIGPVGPETQASSRE